MPNVQMPNGDVVGFPDDMPPEQIKGMIATKFPTQTAINSDWQKRGDAAAAAMNNPNLNPLGKAALEAETGIGAGYDVAKEGIKSAWNAAPKAVTDPLASAGQYVSDEFAKTPEGVALKMAAPVIGQKAQEFSEEHPNIAHVAGVAADVIPAVPAMEGIAGAAKLIPDAAKGVEGLADAYAAKYPEGTGPLDPAKIKTVDKYLPSSPQKALFQTHTDALTHDADLYNWRDQMAAGKVGSAANTKDTLYALINDARSKVANPSVEDSVVSKLSDIRSKISPDGRVPLDALTDLDKFYNSLYGSARFSDSPTLGLARNATKADLDSAAKIFPEFGDAHYAANDFHTNLKSEWDNGVMSPIYNSDDTRNMDMFLRGKTADVNPETKARGQNFMQNIENKGVVGYQQVLSKLPEEQKPAFEQAFKDFIIGKDGNNRWNAIKGALADPFTNTGRKVLDVVYPQYEEGTKSFFAAQKGKMPFDYGADQFSFDKFLDNSKSQLDEMKNFQKEGGYGFSMPGQKALPAPTTRAHPAPNAPNYTVNSIGEASPTSGVDRMDMAAKRAVEPNAGVTLGDDRGIPDPRSAPSFHDITNQNTIINNQNKNIPLSQVARNPTAAGAVAPAAKILDDTKGALDRFQKGMGINPNSDKYKQGGAVVDRRPTEAQKAAGNYKKYHTKLHGLDISIETPRNAVRTGNDKDGKKWSVKMPDHYGYIRRTEGADGDHVDCYLGPNLKSRRIYVIDQKEHDTGKFDEHKVMIGYGSRDEAVAAYRAGFSDKKDRLKNITRMTVDEFKAWLKKGNTKTPTKKVA